MSEIKTKPTAQTVEQFIAAVEHPGKRAEGAVLDTLFRKVTGEKPRMWGPTIIGYGTYHYRYESGHEGDMCRVGFSPRKAKHSLYLVCNCDGPGGADISATLERLGKYSQGTGGCLYVNKLADIDLAVLEELISLSWADMERRYPSG
jgi:Domain of unknown function (DU1801)